jgi:hypothetical protein
MLNLNAKPEKTQLARWFLRRIYSIVVVEFDGEFNRVPHHAQAPHHNIFTTQFSPPTPGKRQNKTSLTVKGLKAPIELLRDKWGVNHIYTAYYSKEKSKQ